MLKGLGLNPFITRNSSLAEIEAELTAALDRAENVLDWNITEEEELRLVELTRLARAKGSKRKW